jgi:predicted transposase YbfD/YdcC
VDGKRLRRSVTAKQQQTKKVEGGKQAVQMFHAWSASLRLCLAQKQIQSKNNEISELPNLLDLLEISGCIITADSMNCQRATAEYIIDNEANYVLAVKDNQPSLVAAIKEVFQTAEQEQPQIESVKTVEKSHGRQETRICEVLPASVIAHKIDLSLWSGISCIVRTTSIRKAPYKSETQDYRYHISSLPINAIKLYEIIRGHWAIENQLHWVLDVCMGEDTSHKQQNNAAANISCIRKMIMNVLNSFDFSTLGFKQKLSLNRKRRIAALYEHVLDACIKQLLPDLVACCSHNDTT